MQYDRKIAEYSIQELLNEIKLLRSSTLEEEDFWQVYINLYLKLCKASTSFILEKKDKEFIFKQNAGFTEDNSVFKEQLIQSAVDLSSKALKNTFSFEPKNFKNINYIVLTIKLYGNNNYYITLLINKDNKNLSELILRAQLLSDVYSSFLAHKKTISNQDIKEIKVDDNSLNIKENTNSKHIYDVLEVTTLVKSQKNFKLALMTLVNDLAVRFDCTCVYIGWANDGYIKTQAISYLEKFEEKTSFIKELEYLFEETADQNKEILYPFESSTNLINKAHENYYKKLQLSELLSLPLRKDDEVLGVITFSKIDSSFKEEELISLRLALNHITFILESLANKDMSFFEKSKNKIRSKFDSFFTFEHTLTKLISVIISFFLLCSFIFKLDYNIEATGNLTTDNILYLSAPYNASVEVVNVSSGDKVLKNDLLLKLDSKELYLKLAEVQAEISRYNADALNARSKNKLADLNIAYARLEQASAKYKKFRTIFYKSSI